MQQRFSFSPSPTRSSQGHAIGASKGELVALSAESLGMSAVTDVIDAVAELMSVRHEVQLAPSMRRNWRQLAGTVDTFFSTCL
jgi:hypothetical protein